MNRRGMWAGAVALFATVLVSHVATAQNVPTQRTDVEPSNGVPYQLRTGWFAETQVGVFTAFGGSKAASNAQPYLALSIGMDLPKVSKHFSIFLTAALGSNAGSCRQVDADNLCTQFKLEDGSTAMAPENFNIIPIELGARWGFKDIAERLHPYVGVVAGYSLITPQIFQDAPGGSAHAGVLGGIQYGTRLNGLTLGVELMVRYAFSPAIPSFAAYPRIAYVF